MKSNLVFGDLKLKKEFLNLNNKELKIQLKRAFNNLIENTFCGIQIPKRLIPKEYFKRFGNLTNLWKYNLPGAWRLIYTIKNSKVLIVSVLVEWIDHKKYERRFNF